MASIYPHGVYVSEQETSLIAPIVGTAGLQVIIGTAPVNMLVNPEEAVNKPLLVYSYKEAVMSVGYSDNFEKYTLCESINANFQVVNTAPLILINVLDPKKHSAVLPEEQIDVTEGIAVIAHTGVLVDKLTVKNGDTVMKYDEDYTVEFQNSGYLHIIPLEGGAGDGAAVLTVS